MHSSESLRGVPRRRPRIWRFVITALLIAAIGEPIVMYCSLVREKEKRRAAAEKTIEAKAVRTAVAP